MMLDPGEPDSKASAAGHSATLPVCGEKVRVEVRLRPRYDEP